MEFFNKKEEVLEIVLTDKGRELFASGRFKPTYYSFHDTDVIYDSNLDSEQNSSVERIKDTPTLKSPTNIFLESPKNVATASNHLDTTNNFKLFCELGNKSLADQYKPAWELNFKQAPQFQFVGDINNPRDNKSFQIKLSSSLDNNSNQEQVPQIDIQTIYQLTSLVSGSLIEKFTLETYLLEDPPVILEIEEFNSFDKYEKQELEIEAYWIKNKYQAERLSFNKDLDNNVYKYVSILFDNFADFEEKANTKDIYGDLTDKDDSTC